MCQEGGASLIFWNHSTEEFNYLGNGKDDMVVFNKIKKQLMDWRLNRIISKIGIGSTMRVGNVRWYILQVKIECVMCYPNFLLSKDGDWDNVEWTPFLFKDRCNMYHFYRC